MVIGRSKQVRTRSAARAAVAALAVVLVLASLAASDSAGEGRAGESERALSESSRALLAGLLDVVTVTVYMSQDLPPNMERFRTRLREVIEGYRAYGGDRLRVSFVDPASDPEMRRRAELLGVHPIRVQTPGDGGVQVMNVTLGITVRCRNREEVIPLLVSPDRLEYDLTLSIAKVTARELPRIGFLTGHGERSVATDYRTVARELSRSYQIEEIDLAFDPEALKGVATLVVPGSRHVPDAELFRIDQFIMRGGRALFLLDGAEIQEEGLRSRPTQGNIFDFVASYGATVNPDLVVDRVNSNASFRTGATTRALPYPFWPKAVPPGVSRESPVVSGLDVISFPWTSSITLAEMLPEDVEATVLARSSGHSWSVPAVADLSPGETLAPTGGDAAEARAGRGAGRILAVALTGEFTSPFSGKPVIVEHGRQVEFTEPAGALERSARTRIIVVGNSRMFEDKAVGMLEGSSAFFQNAVDWLTYGSVLAGIGPRPAPRAPLAEPPGGPKAPVRLLAALSVLIAVVALGLAGAIAWKGARTRR
jgi:ABC-type uncharacterized transport system involved in gliding motility auxiliary subunit